MKIHQICELADTCMIYIASRRCSRLTSGMWAHDKANWLCNFSKKLLMAHVLDQRVDQTEQNCKFVL